MAWRPSNYLVGGTLDNTHLGRVIGALQFVGMDELVRLELVGDFHRDIRGAKLELLGAPNAALREDEARPYFARFSSVQTGKVGDITAGLRPHDYGRYPYIEWYSEQNGRVVLEYDAGRVRVIGSPIPYQESYSISREQQARNMAEFLRSVGEELLRENDNDNNGDGSGDKGL